MRGPTRSIRFAVCTVALTLIAAPLLAGCGGDDSDASGVTPENVDGDDAAAGSSDASSESGGGDDASSSEASGSSDASSSEAASEASGSSDASSESGGGDDASSTEQAGDTGTSAAADEFVVGQYPCSDPVQDEFLQITVDGLPCAADRTEQCSIAGENGLIRSTSQLEWSDRAAAVLKVNISGQIVEAAGTVTVTGAVAEFDGQLPDGRAATAAADCTSGP